MPYITRNISPKTVKEATEKIIRAFFDGINIKPAPQEIKDAAKILREWWESGPE